MTNISIITAAYSDTYLDSVWASIKEQTFKSWEWIIVVDDSASVMEWYLNKEIDGEFKGYDVWIIEIGKNQGRYGLVGRNVGAMCASYDRMAFLDDDNKFDCENYLESMVRAERETGKIPYSELHLVGKKPGSTYDRIKRTALARHNIDLGNPLYKREHFLKYGYFDDSKNKIMFDYDLIEKIKDGEGEDAFVKVNVCLLFRHKRY